ncbi:MAG: VWA domain-containing protein [Verrucomicrobiales bacterium]
MEKIAKLFVSALGVFGLAGGTVCDAAGPPEAPVGVRASVDRPLLPKHSKDRRVVVKIEVEGAATKRANRTPLNLAIVLDRSGSMRGAKLEQAKQAAEMLVDQLDGDDVLSLVVYETEVEVLVPSAPLGNRGREIKNRIRRIESGGSTALHGGVEQGGRQLEEFLSRERINRVILLSDGLANVGPSSNREIAGLGRRLAEKGGSVTTIGLGDDYNETLMTTLAEAGDANYYYVADVESLPEVFERELGELKTIVARRLEIEIHCPRGVRPLRFLGRPGELKSQRESVVFGTLSGEQSRELYLECVLDEEGFGEISEIAEIAVSYDDASTARRSEVGRFPVVVGYTDDVELATSAEDKALQAEAAVFANAVETEKAIRLADSGDIEGSRSQLESQLSALARAHAAAPAAQKQILGEEIDAVKEAQEDLANNRMSKAQRKKLSRGSFELRNSKR